MTIGDLRHIGKRLLEEIPNLRFAEGSQIAVKKGASGDKTFPMDEMAEDIIMSYLESMGKPLRIVSEEYGIKDLGVNGQTIVIDPIDGSKNAITGLPLFSSSIAVVDGNRIGNIILGYVINLVSGDEFWAERGKGAYLNGKKIGTQRSDELILALYEAQNPSRDIQKVVPLLSVFRRTRCLGSVALDLAHIAMGSASIFVSPFDSRSFDFASGWLLVREAGGVVTDLNGAPLDNEEIHLGYSAPLLASANEVLHKRALEVIQG